MENKEKSLGTLRPQGFPLRPSHVEMVEISGIEPLTS